ncbi:hypothetical protein [Bacillus sp. ISL-37]|uniref:hypothetical protein n=1 Tax=Bacillus sp. ISL-37 TaxID=2819123 RepID=UPI001BE50058|nr:hypothetical protein [Bacillus sp. ISL-37]MBT2682365.1 hypothetical protein [Bacillus sp. ISL-37]
MNKGILLFIVGLIMYMAGIYLSTIWVMIGATIGVSGGILMGASTYLLALKKRRDS